ncbi:MAG: Polyketide cyclase / dehydrase and lipid transport [Thermoplasmata archaeon]|nr:Polyketide cyclase / dehydrase and lipid transport [Thermoplasmata archaeon]MEA3165202.1 Polyketide cyclase / dehydrase and lipid transport [Thermoplasmata archaeon]
MPAVKVTVRRKVKAPIHQAWPKLADLAALPKWAPDVASCKAETLRLGARRVATLKEPAYGKDKLVETVNALRPQGFTYDIEGGIGPLETILTSWDLEPKGDDCVVKVTSEVKLAGKLRFAKPLVWLSWRRQVAALANGFAKYAAAP